MEIIDSSTIKLDRELSELDLFVLDFVRILEKHTLYALVSGYVALLFGRSRATEDVDLYITRLTREQFHALYQELQEHGFVSILVDDEQELFSMLQDHLSIRFARKGTIIPNMEIKFIRDSLDMISLQARMTVITKQGNLFIAPIDLQIAYKKFVLQSPKDLEDARHLQKLFSIPEEKINKCKEVLHQYGRC